MSSSSYNEYKENRLLFLYSQVEKLQQFLNETDPMNSVSGDGVSASVNRLDVIKELSGYRREIERLEGGSPRCSTMEFQL